MKQRHQDFLQRTEAQVYGAVQDYLKIGMMLDEGLKQQAMFDLDALQRATARRLMPLEQKRVIDTQHQALRWTFIGSGMTHPKVLETIGAVCPEARILLEQTAPAFC